MKRCFVGVSVAVCVTLHWGQAAAAEADPAASIRVEQADGVWSFVNPNGERFFSLGVNCVEPGPSREHYDPAHPAYAAFRYYDSTEHWADDVLVRLQSWNFNTLGGWCDHAVTRGPLAYTKVLHLGSTYGVPWIDVFAPDFPTKIDRIAEERVVPCRDDRFLMGYFTDNELGWYPDTLFLFHLHQSAQSATRQRLIKLLDDHYNHDFDALGRDFTVTNASSFAELALGGDLHPTANGNAQDVIREFAGLIAERYYKVVHDSIRKYDANHLILGDRYNGFCPDDVARAAGKYVDVLSTNYDWPLSGGGFLPLNYLRRLHELSGKPVLVTEYYVAARQNRSGNPNSGNIFTTVETQEDRATAFATRLRTLANEPYVVGTHWFDYSDEPPRGRPGDGEDYNFGLVDIENRPYEQLTDEMTKVHGRVNEMHAASRNNCAASNHGSKALQMIPPAKKDVLDGVTGWEKRSCIPTDIGGALSADLLACWDSDKVYLAVVGVRYVDQSLYKSPGTDKPAIPLMQFSVDAVDGKSVSIRFGNCNEVIAEDGGVDCRAWQGGVRYTAIAAIPASVFGKQRLEVGDQLKLRAVIRDLREDGQTQWHATIRLD